MDPARTFVRTLSPAQDRRQPAAIGRHARLELVFARRNGRTVLTHRYAEPPYHVGRAFDCGDAASVIIACTGPGLFAGDDVSQSIRLEEGARVLIASQSALQVHPGPIAAPARVRQEFSVAPGAELHCQWDPVIPFARASLSQETDVTLEAGARLFWSDALMTGRAARGETWACAAIAHQIRVTAANRLVYLERYRLNPAERPVINPWLAGDAAFLGTALVYHPGVTDHGVESLQQALNAEPSVRAGVDVAEKGLAVARLLGRHGSAFSASRAAVRDWAERTIFSAPALRFRR
jgi:urease accessory protein UreH